MLFQTQFVCPDDSTYGQHLLMVRMFGSKDPEVFLPRDYVWCEADGLLFVRRTIPTNDLPWEPVVVPPSNSTVTIQLLARPRPHDPLKRHRKGARPSIVDPQQNLDWLHFTAGLIGLRIEDAEVETQYRTITKPSVTRKNIYQSRFTLIASYFSAVATVLDSARFERGLATGIGDSKAYGCGYIHFWPRGQ